MGQNLESHFLHLAHLIRSINDPEHPLTLEELNVVEQVRIQVSSSLRVIKKVPLLPQRLVFSVHKHLRGSVGGMLMFMEPIKSWVTCPNQ